MSTHGFVKRHYKAFLLFSTACLICLSLGMNMVILPWYDKQFGAKPIQVQALGDNPEDNTTAAYLFQSSGIPGSFIRKIPNFDYFWNLFKSHSVWQLEGWNPQTQQWVSEWNGENLNNWLAISKVRSGDSFNEKVSLTVTNHAPIATKFRFTFGIDLRVKEFVNRTGQYEYTLTYQANKTDNYNMRFNWSDLIPLVRAGTISLNHGIKNIGGKDLFWFRITGNSNLGVGKSFTVDPTYGLIGDAVTNSWEYNKLNGQQPDMIRLGTSEYYAIVSNGLSNDGFINTTRVWNNNGTIQTSCVDSLEYDTTDGAAPSICHVSGDVYAISYYDDAANQQKVVTISIDDADGQIGAAVIDTQILTYDSATAAQSRSKIIHVIGGVYAIVYSRIGVAYTLYLETIQINDDGTIDDVLLDSVSVSGVEGGVYPYMTMVDSDTIVVVYTESASSDGYMSTWNITAAGDITATYSSFWEFDTSKGGTPTIAKVTGNIFMVAYEDTNSDLYVKTCQINDTGSIWKAWIDIQAIDTTNGDYPTFFNVSVNSIANKWIKGITFSGEGSDGYVSTFDVDSTGAIGSEIDTLELVPADTVGWYMPACWVSGFYFLEINTDSANDGWAKTFQIYANLPPTIANPSPADDATGVSTTPQLSVNVSDIGDYLNATWSSNSSGTWKNFGTNSSFLSYGAIRDSVVSSYEYDAQEGKYPDAIKLGSDGTYSYFAIVSTGDLGTENDGYIRTIKVWESNGTIYPTLVDSYEYDSTDGVYPSVVYVSGDIYAICYQDTTSSIFKVVTIHISSVGDIDTVTGIIDTLSLSSASSSTTITSKSVILNINNTLYVAVYVNNTGTNINVALDTFTITSLGDISAIIDTKKNAVGTVVSAAVEATIIDINTIAIVSQDQGTYDGYLTTYNISDVGDITNTYADQWIFYTTATGGSREWPDIIKINNTVYAISHRDDQGDGWVKTLTIANTGIITKSWIDTYEFDVADCAYTEIIFLGNNLYGISYQGTDGDGFIKTIKITNAGDISCFEYDFLEFDPLDSIFYAPMRPVANDYYLIVYEGTGSDGWSCTVKIGNDTTTTIKQTNSNFSAASTTYYWRVNVSDGVNQNYSIYSFTTAGAGGNTPPIFSDETPTNNSIGIAIDVGQLTILINDTEGDTFGYEWGCSDGSSNSAAGNTNGSKILMLNMGDLDYSTLYTWWINATDEHGDWTNETYYFTTETNACPESSAVYPVNLSTGVPFAPQCHIYASDDNGNTMDVNFYNSSNGITYYHRQANMSLANGTYYWTYDQAADDLTVYYWKVTIDDGTCNSSFYYSFTTKEGVYVNLSGLTADYNLTWNGDLYYPNQYNKFCNNSGDAFETVQIDIDVEGKYGISDIMFWMSDMNKTATGKIMGAKNCTVWVSTTGVIFERLNDNDGNGPGVFKAPYWGLWWNWTTSPGGIPNPFTYHMGGYWIDADTTLYARFQYNLSSTLETGTYYNDSDWYIDGYNNTDYIAGSEHFNGKYVVTDTTPVITRNATNVFDYYFVCGNESIRTSTNAFDYYFVCGNESIRTQTNVFDYYFICGNESIRTPTNIFDYYFYCGNETILHMPYIVFDYYFVCGNESARTSTKAFDYYFYCGNESVRTSTLAFDYYFYCGNESAPRYSVNIFDYYFYCGNESTRVSTNVFDYYFNCSNESIPMNITPATPYNLNLLVINPNPGNGTHNTNYLKANASGLTTSIDIFYENFTSPPTSPPSYVTIAIDGTPPANAPCLYNSSTNYTHVWANTTGTISTTDLFVGQYKAGADYVTYRGFLTFDTSIIPDDAVLDSVNVSLVILTFASLTDFNVTLQEVKHPVPHDPLIGTDYNKAAVSGDFGHENTTGYTDDDYFNISLNAAWLNYIIDKTGDTVFGIRSYEDIVASAPINSEIIGFYAYSFAPFYPKLVISYHTPNPDWKHLVNLTWYSNSSGAWLEYHKSYVNSNGTVTVPNANFSGIDTYYWHLEWESNGTNIGSSQIFEFETVADGGSSMNTRDRFTLGLILGSMVFMMLGFVMFRKKKRKI